MKQFITILIVCMMFSCTKERNYPGTASLTLINAVPNSTPSLVTNFSGTDAIKWYRNALKLVYGTSGTANQSLAYTGGQPLAVYRYPDTLAHSTPLYNLMLELQPGSIYTLFLTGTLAAPDTMLTIDNPPYHPVTDSSLSVRVVNLSAGSAPVSVNIAGSANGSEVSSLSYKSITGFKNYAATAGISHYNFEFRDAATGALLISYDLTGIANTANNARRYRNFTLAYMGLPGDATTRKITLVETYTSN